MNTNQPETFDRRFTATDAVLFRDLIAGIVGQLCVAWRKSYGRTGHLHFGALVERPHLPAKAVHRLTGEWIIDLADADRVLVRPGADTLDSRRDGDDRVLAELKQLEATTLREIVLDPSSLSLRISLSSGHVLELLTDHELSADDEQWAIQLPNGLALLVYGNQRWALEPNRPTGPT